MYLIKISEQIYRYVGIDDEPSSLFHQSQYSIKEYEPKIGVMKLASIILILMKSKN